MERKRKGKRKFLKYLLLWFLIIVPIISYKYWIYNSYQGGDCEENKMMEENLDLLKKATTVTINKKEYTGDYLEHGDIKIPDQFKDYLLTYNFSSDVSYTVPKKAILSFGSLSSEVDSLRSIGDLCMNCEKEINKIIKENNLITDMDVLNYVKNYKCNKYSFFTSIKNLKRDFIVSNYIKQYIMNAYSKIVYITGDYNGYMYSDVQDDENGNISKYYVVLENNGKNYYINIVTYDNFPEQQMYDVISSVVIK